MQHGASAERAARLTECVDPTVFRQLQYLLIGLLPHILERANRSQGRDAKPRAETAFAVAAAWLPKGQCGQCTDLSAQPDLLNGYEMMTRRDYVMDRHRRTDRPTSQFAS